MRTKLSPVSAYLYLPNTKDIVLKIWEIVDKIKMDVDSDRLLF